MKGAEHKYRSECWELPLTPGRAAGLEPLGLCLADALLVQLYLADMGHFVAANAAYARHFGGTSPPARACVQAALPAGMAASVDVLLPPPGAAGCAPRPFIF